MPTLNLGKIRFNWRGTYSAVTAYAINDCVAYGVHSYVCIAATTAGTDPTNGTYWQVMTQGIASPLTARGDLWYRGAAADARLPIGAAGTFLQSTGADPAWQAAPFRPHDTADKLAHMNDVGQGSFVMAFITADKKQIKIAGRDGGNGALAGGNTPADFYQDVFTAATLFNGTGQVTNMLDDDDYFVDLAVGHYMVAAVTNKGYLYTGGYNNYGQLGHGDTINRQYLQRVAAFFTGGANPRNIKKVYIANDQYWQYCSLHVVTDTGEVWGAGYNNYGELGNGTTTNQPLFVRAGTITGITELSVNCSLASIYALNKTAGTMYVWGNNDSGQLGLGNTTQQTSPVLSALTNIKKVISAGSNYYDGTNHGAFGKFAAVLRTDGTVWTTGMNGTGSLGLGDTTNRTTWTRSASAPATTTDIFMGGGGYYSSALMALTTGGQLYATGHNWAGNLGVGDTTQRNTFTLCVFPAGVQGTIAEVKCATASRYAVAVARTTGGKLYYAGHPLGMWLGGDAGTQQNSFVAVSMPAGATVADYQVIDTASSAAYETGFGLFIQTTAGEVMAAGYNAYGQIGRATRRSQNGLASVMV